MFITIFNWLRYELIILFNSTVWFLHKLYQFVLILFRKFFWRFFFCKNFFFNLTKLALSYNLLFLSTAIRSKRHRFKFWRSIRALFYDVLESIGSAKIASIIKNCCQFNQGSHLTDTVFSIFRNSREKESRRRSIKAVSHSCPKTVLWTFQTI